MSYLTGCGDFPECLRGVQTPDWSGLSFGALGGLILAPLFVPVILILRRIVPDPAARVFAAAAIVTFAVSSYGIWWDLRNSDPCTNPHWGPWAWGGVLANAGAAAVLAHWIVVRGLGSIVGGRDRLLGRQPAGRAERWTDRPARRVR